MSAALLPALNATPFLTILMLCLSALALPALAGGNSDGIATEFKRRLVTISWHDIPAARVLETCDPTGRFDPPPFGCAKIPENPAAICHVFVPPPQATTDLIGMARFGHEILHCFRGRFHPVTLTPRPSQ